MPRHPSGKAIESELGTCLRLIEAEPSTELRMPIDDAQVFAFWEKAENHFFDAWQFKTDPRNLQPKIRKLNRDVIEFLEASPLDDVPEERVRKAIKILESVWGRRDEAKLRMQFALEESSKKEKATSIIDWVVEASGLLPLEAPQPLPPIEKEDIRLLCWMVVDASD